MELGIIFLWWFFITLLGIITVPISIFIFHKISDERFMDLSYSASKFLGLVLLTYLSYIIARLGLLSFTWLTIFISFLAILLFSIYLINSKNLGGQDIKNKLKSRNFLKTAVKIDVIFLIIFVLFLVIRAYVPDIKGGETFYDLAYLNTIIRTEKLPPTHTWFSQVNLDNYYYFGHLMLGTISKFLGISGAYSYNLGLVTIMAFVSILTYGLTYNLTKKSKYAIIAIFLITFSGNIFSLIQVINYEYPKIDPQIRFYEPPQHGTFLEKAVNYNWWVPSRIIPWAIHEMPFWTFIWGDLHGHLFALAFRLIVLFFILNFFFSKNIGFRIFGETNKEKILRIFFFSMSLGFIFPTNIYDFPLLSLMIFITFLFHSYMHENKSKKFSIKTIINPFLISLVIVLTSLFLYSPVVFQLLQHINDPLVKILPHEENSLLNTGSPNSFHFEVFKTSLYHFLLLFSLEILLIALFILNLFYTLYIKKCNNKLKFFALIIFIIYLFLCISVFLNYFSRLDFFYNQIDVNIFSIKSLIYDFQLLIILIPIIIGSSLLFYSNEKIVNKEMKFVLLLIIFGSLVVLITEIVNIEGRYVFMNKIYGEIYILWGLTSAYILYFFGFRKLVSIKYLPLSTLILLLIVSYSIFPILTTIQKTNVFKPTYGRQNLTINGYDWLKREHKNDYLAIEWINKNIKGTPVILEVPGRDYQYTSRVSVFTGLPTVLGWVDHMELHLAVSRDNIQKIDREIDMIYDTKNNAEALLLLKKYNVDYIYVGELEKNYKGIYIHGNERETKNYSKLGLEKFNKYPEFYKLIYNESNVQIYKIIKKKKKR